MPDSFDPYHKWLGISPKDQPPNHYRLLGVEAFESDPEVIESAADQRMTHVRTFQTGQNSALSQRILNEVSAARLCLLNPERKAAYDRQLRESLARVTPSSAVRPPPAALPPRPLPQARPLVSAQPVFVPDAGSAAVRRPRHKTPIWGQPAVLGMVSAALVLVLVVYFVVTALTSGTASDASQDTLTAANEKPPPQPRQPKDPSLASSEGRVKSEKSSSPAPVKKTDDASSSWQKMTRELNDIAFWKTGQGAWFAED